VGSLLSLQPVNVRAAIAATTKAADR